MADKTYRLGLIGENISYSMSPEIHRFSGSALDLDVTYDLFDVASDKIDRLLKQSWGDGLAGFNVTVPHKGAVAKAVGSSLQSVNTVYRGDHGWEATSTDGKGFERAVAHLGHQLTAFDRIVMIGAGGACQSLMDHLAEQQFAGEVFIHCRNLDRRFPTANRVTHWHELNVTKLAKHLKNQTQQCLLVQASSAPKHGDDLSALVPALADFNGVVVDMVYHQPSALLTHAQDRGLSCQDGLPMLIEQARLAQEIWWGKSASFEKLHEHMRKLAP